MKKIIAFTLSLSLFSLPLFSMAQTVNTDILATPAQTVIIKDVPANHWAREAVSLLIQKGIVKGYSDQTFRGNQPVTRYEVAQMLAPLLTDGTLASAAENLSSSEKETITHALSELASQIAILNTRQSDNAQSQDAITQRLKAVEQTTEQIVKVGATRADVDNATLQLRNDLNSQLASYATKDELQQLKDRVDTLEKENQTLKDAVDSQKETQKSATITSANLPEVVFRPDPPMRFAVGGAIEKIVGNSTIGYGLNVTGRNLMGSLGLEGTLSYHSDNTYSGQINIIKPFGVKSQFTPYLGIGAGVMSSASRAALAAATTDTSTTTTATGTTTTTTATTTTTSTNATDFFLSGLIGLDYNFTDTMILFAEADVRDYFSNNGAGNGLSSTQTKGIGTTFKAGVKINF